MNRQRKKEILLNKDSVLGLMQEIYNELVEQRSTAIRIQNKMLGLLKDAEDMTVIGPVIKDLVKFSVENDDILIRLATIGQRFVAMEYKGTNDGGLLSDKEKEELLGELEKISKDVQAKTMDKVDDIEYELEEIQRKLEQTKK